MVTRTEAVTNQVGHAAPERVGAPRGGLERGLLLLIGLYLLTLPLVTHDLRAADEIEYFAYLHSLTFDHDLNFLNEYQYFLDRFPEKYACQPDELPDCKKFKETFIDTVTVTGRRPNFGPIGTAVLWAPFFGVGHLVALGWHAAGGHVALDGYSKPYLWAITFGSAFYALAGLALAYWLCRTLVSQWAAFWATLAIWLGTPVIFYSHLAPGYSHAASLFAVSLFLFLWARWRDDLTVGRAIAVGAAGGLIAMVREQDALFLAVPTIYAGIGALGALRHGAWRELVRLVAPIVVLGLAAIVTFIPQLVVYQILNGEMRPNQDVSDKMNIISPYLIPVMTDPAHALPYWSPIVLLALFGLVLLIRHSPRFGLALIAGFLLTWYINGAIKTWTTAGSFGARRFLNCTPIFIIGLAYAYEAISVRVCERGGAWRALVPVLSVLAIAWNCGLIVQFVLDGQWMNRQQLEWPKNLVNQFRLPAKLPGVIHRLIADRHSFYRQR
jgi:hypothetical protein